MHHLSAPLSRQKAKWVPLDGTHPGKINTYSGQVIDFNNINVTDIRIDDIIHALSNICRFGGHSGVFYSVAQHSCLVAAMAPDELKKPALLHDACEAYVGDMIKPFKNLVGSSYRVFEDEFSAAIADKFGLKYKDFLDIKYLDEAALELEHAALIKGNFATLLSALSKYQLESYTSWAWSPQEARSRMNQMYSRLFEIDLHLLCWA